MLRLERVSAPFCELRALRDRAVIRACRSDRYGTESVGGAPSPPLPRADRGRGGGGC